MHECGVVVESVGGQSEKGQCNLRAICNGPLSEVGPCLLQQLRRNGEHFQATIPSGTPPGFEGLTVQNQARNRLREACQNGEKLLRR